jgi:hypothetical protein
VSFSIMPNIKALKQKVLNLIFKKIVASGRRLMETIHAPSILTIPPYSLNVVFPWEDIRPLTTLKFSFSSSPK